VKNDAYLKLDATLHVATSVTAMSAEHELSEHPTRFGGERDLQLVLDESGSSALGDIQILVREGRRIAAYKPGVQNGLDLREIPADALKDEITVQGFRIAARNFRAPQFGANYQIYSAKPVAPAIAQLARIRVALVVFVPIGLGLAGLAGYLLAEKSLRPLKQLAQTVDAVTSSDLSARVKLSNQDDEIGTLGRRFNSLLDRLEAAFTLQRRFMADASHQIRTPVTIALAAAQVTRREPNATPRDCKDSLHIIENQMLQLRRTVEDMFFLSQADASPLKLELKEMYLDDALSDALHAAKELSRDKRQTLRLRGFPEAECLGDADLLKQAVLILLDNSVKFTPAGGDIEIALARRGKRWVCSVTDSGAGISEAAQARIFERFYREIRAGDETGAGLGLAIARSIVESHGGTLTLVGSRPGRTIFEMAIPILPRETMPDGAHANSFSVRI
jgi:signal transduction histidine kinase